MSFQACLDALEEKTGSTPRQLLDIAAAKGFSGENIKALEVLEWLKTDYGVGRGHGMALVHVVKKGPGVDRKHVGTTGTHRDNSDTLWLDGRATRPA